MFIRLLLLSTLLSACTFGVPIGDTKRSSNSSSSSSSSGTYVKPTSYIVYGKRYNVLNSAEGFSQRGIASWYGKKFHGRKTSNGETYDMFAMTAAHKTLPLPTMLLVKNLENGKSIRVKVNDRGPFVDERILDLSYAAAKKLGVIQKGTAKVEIKVINKNNSITAVRTIPLKPADADNVEIFVQVASFSQKINAENLLLQLKQKQIPDAKIYPFITAQATFFRIRLGPYSIVEKAQSVVELLHKKSYKDSRLVID